MRWCCIWSRKWPPSFSPTRGIIEYVPELYGSRECLMLRARVGVHGQEVRGLDSDLPSPALLVVGFCNLDRASLEAAIGGRYRELADRGDVELAEIDALVAAFFEGTALLEVNGIDTVNGVAGTPLGHATAGELHLLAFTELEDADGDDAVDPEERQIINPEPYLFALSPAFALDGAPLLMDGIVLTGIDAEGSVVFTSDVLASD